MANEIQYRNHTAYNNGTSAENNIKLLDITPFQHEDLSSGVNKLGKMLVAQSFCEPVAVCNSNNPQNGVYVATCSNYPDFALSYQDAQQNTKYLIGLKIRVIFTYGITYGSVSGGTYPTLNINGSGAIPMLAQGKTMATGSASAGQSIEFTVIPYGNGVAFDADSNVRESTSDYTIYTDGLKRINSVTANDKNMITSDAVYKKTYGVPFVTGSSYTSRDLNDFKTEPLITFINNGGSAWSHCVGTGAYILIVILCGNMGSTQFSYVRQLLFAYDSSNVYTRAFNPNGSVWSAWKDL
jgi:hypothetical protein